MHLKLSIIFDKDVRFSISDRLGSESDCVLNFEINRIHWI